MVTIFYTPMLFSAFAFRDISTKCTKASSFKPNIKLKAQNQQLFFVPGWRWSRSLYSEGLQWIQWHQQRCSQSCHWLRAEAGTKRKGKKYSVSGLSLKNMCMCLYVVPVLAISWVPKSAFYQQSEVILGQWGHFAGSHNFKGVTEV